jgi:hypothetical protein
MPFIQLQFRRDTSNNWYDTNPTLASGELAIEVDTNSFKIGDGRTSWRALPYGGIQGPRGPQGPSGLTGGASGGGPYWIELAYSTISGEPFSGATVASGVTSYLPPSYTVSTVSSIIRLTNSNVTNSNAWQLTSGPLSIQYATGNSPITSWLTAQTWDYTSPSAGVVTNTAGVMSIDSTFINLTGYNPFTGNGNGAGHVLARLIISPFFYT